MTEQTLSAAAWDAMRAMGEFVASRGDAVGEKLEAWTKAKEAFDAKVREVDQQLRSAKLAAVELEAALEFHEAGAIDSFHGAMRTAQALLEGKQ